MKMYAKTKEMGPVGVGAVSSRSAIGFSQDLLFGLDKRKFLENLNLHTPRSATSFASSKAFQSLAVSSQTTRKQ